jgi:hypothetical protein
MTPNGNGLWHDHATTPCQQEIAFSSSERRGRPTQADVLLSMLREARRAARPLELPEIMRAGVAQHGARFAELRERGFVIDNEMERTARRVLSRYWLRLDPERDGAR